MLGCIHGEIFTNKTTFTKTIECRFANYSHLRSHTQRSKIRTINTSEKLYKIFIYNYKKRENFVQNFGCSENAECGVRESKKKIKK